MGFATSVRPLRPHSIERETVSTPDATLSPTARYAPLGLVANPFNADPKDGWASSSCEIGRATNLLLNALVAASHEAAPKPLWVRKAPDLAHTFPITAVARAESVLAVDDSLNILHAYIPLMNARVGLARATLTVVAERMVYRDVAKTLACYLKRVLAEPDDSLASYLVMGAERLDEFSARFSEDPQGATDALFGQMTFERRPELGEVGDMRLSEVEALQDGEESFPELDETVGEPPGSILFNGEPALPADTEDSWNDVLDYVVEHTRVHLSPVVARSLRVYHDRGQFAMAGELMITKSPRKTLAALIRLATARFAKVAIIFDDFDQWLQIEDDLRSKLVGAFSEMRWAHDGGSVMTLLMTEGEAPEIEETFAGATAVDWSFSGLSQTLDNPLLLIPEVVDAWLAAATLSGHAPMSTADSALEKLLAVSGSSLGKFIPLAFAAIENAADRGISGLDDTSVATALQAAQA